MNSVPNYDFHHQQARRKLGVTVYADILNLRDELSNIQELHTDAIPRFFSLLQRAVITVRILSNQDFQTPVGYLIYATSSDAFLCTSSLLAIENQLSSQAIENQLRGKAIESLLEYICESLLEYSRESLSLLDYSRESLLKYIGESLFEYSREALLEYSREFEDLKERYSEYKLLDEDFDEDFDGDFDDESRSEDTPAGDLFEDDSDYCSISRDKHSDDELLQDYEAGDPSHPDVLG